MWQSIRPGRTVAFERSMTAASFGAALRMLVRLPDRLDPLPLDQDRPVGQHPTGTDVDQATSFDDSGLWRLAALLGEAKAVGCRDDGEEQGESGSSHEDSSGQSFSTHKRSRVPGGQQ